jgi:hypothetical protein
MMRLGFLTRAQYRASEHWSCNMVIPSGTTPSRLITTDKGYRAWSPGNRDVRGRFPIGRVRSSRCDGTGLGQRPGGDGGRQRSLLRADRSPPGLVTRWVIEEWPGLIAATLSQSSSKACVTGVCIADPGLYRLAGDTRGQESHQR